MEPWSIHRARVDSSWRALSIEINLYTKFANLLPCTHTHTIVHTYSTYHARQQPRPLAHYTHDARHAQWLGDILVAIVNT